MLTPKVAEWFEPKVRSRGDRYLADGRVVELEISRDEIAAAVEGTDTYDVLIDIERRSGGWVLRPDCTCAYAEEVRGCCKHVWATLKAAERRGLGALGGVPGQISLDEDEDLDPIPITRSPKSTVKHQAPPAWITVLDETPRRFTTPDARRTGPIGEVLYVLDVGQSQDRGAPMLALRWREPPAAGSDKPPKVRKLKLGARDIARLINPTDRTICGMLVGAARSGRGYFSSSDFIRADEAASSTWYVNPRLFGLVGPMLRETGRLFSQAKEGARLEPLGWEGESPWEQTLAIVPGSGESGGRCVLTLELRRCTARGVERMALSEPSLLIPGEPGLLMRGGALSPALVQESHRYGPCQREITSRPITPADLPRLMKEMLARDIALPLVWPEDWPVRVVSDLNPRGRVTLRSKAGRGGVFPIKDAATVEVAFEYGEEVVKEGQRASHVEPHRKPAGEQGNGGNGGGEELVLIRRQMEAERALVDRLAALKVKPIPYSGGRMIENKRIAGLVGTLLSEGWAVLGDTAQYRRAGDFKIEVSSGIDWFNLNGHCEFEGQRADIADILRALKSGERFVMLGDGSLGMLPEQWLARHGRWLGLGQVDGTKEGGKGVKFSKAQVGIVDALLAEMPEATCDAQVAAARKKLADFAGIQARREPGTFRGTLREYQREGLGWLHFLTEFGFGGILADDMGLGKTVQLLAHVLDRRRNGRPEEAGPWLVVAPKSLVFNWAREAERFTPELRVLNYTGLDRKGRAQDLSGADLVLTTYATMRLDVEELRKTEFACVVLDEAQAIKNADAQVAKAALLLRARRRLALTGTPVENRIADLWSLMEFLNPGMLGGAAAFREALGNRTGDADLGLLRRAVRPFILRRTKDKVAPELPARSEQTIVCDLGKEQRSLYDGLLKHYRDALLGKGGRLEREGMNKSKIQVLEALLRLRQAACHPALVEVKPAAMRGKAGAGEPGDRKPTPRPAPSARGGRGSEESAKVETLIEMLEELTAEGETEGGHKALVFSQFTSLLALVREQLDARGMVYEYLDGATPARGREAAVDRFQNDDSRRVFLISLKAGGVGLNLTAADYVFLLDPWWNPAVEAQAIDRTHRIGQSRKVIAYRLIARDTVEERIQQLQANKRELAEAIVGEQEGPLSAMTKEDLSWLLS